MSKYFIHVGILTSLVVFFFTEWIADRIMLRAYQLRQNTLHVEYESHSIELAAGVTLVYLILYYIFIRDIFRAKED